MKKYIAVAALLLSLSFAACKQQQSVEGILERIDKCQSIEQLSGLGDDKELNEYLETLPQEDQAKILTAFSEKAFDLVVNNIPEEEE
ncbi:MAG: hypothetical protein K2M07_02275 [Muribaculaceae bacterium]|nr:hypothetical protein [Muribaculaceae bacterium]